MFNKQRIQNIFYFFEQKINKNDFKIFFQNIIATVFLIPYTLIVYIFILALTTEFINDKLIKLLALIISLILMFTIVGLYLLFIYMSFYIKNGILFKIVKLTSLFLILSYNIYICC